MRLAVPGPCLRPAGRQRSLIKATLSSSCCRVLQGGGGRTVGAGGSRGGGEGCSGDLPSPGSVLVFRRYYCSLLLRRQQAALIPENCCRAQRRPLAANTRPACHLLYPFSSCAADLEASPSWRSRPPMSLCWARAARWRLWTWAWRRTCSSNLCTAASWARSSASRSVHRTQLQLTTTFIISSAVDCFLN